MAFYAAYPTVQWLVGWVIPLGQEAKDNIGDVCLFFIFFLPTPPHPPYGPFLGFSLLQEH